MRAPARTRLGAVRLVDDRDDVLPQFLLEERKRQLGVLRIAAMHDLVVRHRDDHRQRLALGNQVVGDETGAAVDVPRRRQLAAATEQVQHRIPAAAVVVRRRVDVHLALAVEHGRVIHVPRDAPVRDRLGVVVRGAVAMDDDGAVARLVGKAGERVVRIDDGHAVHEEPVDIEVRLERTHRQRPHAVGRLVERNRRVALPDRQQNRASGQRDGPGVRRLEPERHRPIVANLRRDDVRAVRIQILDVLVRVPVQVDVGLLGPRLLRRTEDRRDDDARFHHGHIHFRVESRRRPETSMLHLCMQDRSIVRHSRWRTPERCGTLRSA